MFAPMKSAALAILASLVVAGSAQAHQSAHMSFPVHASALRAAESAAIEYWHGDPCSGRVTVRYGHPRETVLGRPVSAWTSATTTSTTNVYTDCVVTLDNSQWWASEEAVDFPAFCGLMVHEFGHLFGHWDDPQHDPRTSVKYPIVTDANEHVRPCVSLYHLFPTSSN